LKLFEWEVYGRGRTKRSVSVYYSDTLGPTTIFV